MIDNRLIEKFYSKMFTIPKKRISVTLGLITIALASILNGTVSRAFFAQRYFFLGLFIIIYLLLSRKYTGLAFNSRRVFFLSFLVLISTEVFDFIAIHVLNSFFLIVIAPSSATALLTLTLYFTSKASEKRIIFTSIAIFLALYPVNYIYSFQVPHRFTAYALTVFAGTLLGYIFIKFLDRDYGIFNTKKLLKSFVLFWLTSKPEYFEKELENAGCDKRGWVKCLSIGDVRLISNSCHPGPIRNIGGAALVTEILRSFENSIYLHSASKHEDNPVSAKEVRKIISTINCSGRCVKACKPFRIEGRKFYLYVYPFDGVKLLIFSGKEAIDDIPSILNNSAENYIGENILVDAHNAHRENFDISAEDFYELEDLIRQAAEIETEEIELEYHFSRRDIVTDTLNCAAVLLLRFGKELHALIMLDGNNIIKEFRDEIERFGAEYGIKTVVISTDNHSKTGVSPKIGYKPVGTAEDREKILPYLQEVFENAQFQSASSSYSKNELIIRTMGKAFFDEVEKAFKVLGEKALYLLATVVVSQLVIAFILGLIIL